MTGPCDEVEAAREAARLEATRVLRGMVEPMGGHVHEAVSAPDWLRVLLVRHDDVVAAGRGVGCVHAARNVPGVYQVAVWLPGTVVCGRCAAGGALQPPDDTEDRTCDRCRTHHPDGVILNVVQVGLYLVWLGLCRPCRDSWVDPDQAGKG